MGARSTYDPAVAAMICDRIADGDPLTKVIADGLAPAYNTVAKWLTEQPEFAASYARARETQADHIFDSIQTRAETASEGDTQRAKLIVETMKWRAERLKPRVYGTRVSAELSGPDGGPIKTETESASTSQLAQALLSVLEMGKDKQ